MLRRLVRIVRFILIIVLSLLIVTVLNVSRFVYKVSNTLFYLAKVLESYVLRRIEMSTRISAAISFGCWSIFVLILSAFGLVGLSLFWIREVIFGIPEEHIEDGILHHLQYESMTVTQLHQRIEGQYCFTKLSVTLFESLFHDLIARGFIVKDDSKTMEICYQLSEKGKQATQTV